MKNVRTFVLLVLLVSALRISAQTTTVTATVVDSDTTAWAGGTVTWRYAAPAGSGVLTDTRTGQTITPTSGTLTLDGSGAMSLSGIVPTQYVSGPIPGLTFNVCPALLNAQCYITSAISIGSTTPQSVSTQINATIKAPRITGGIMAQAYADVEVLAVNGNQYYNVTSNTNRCYVNGAWAGCTSGSATGFPITLGSTSIAANSTTTSITGLDLDGSTATEIGFLSGVTSAIQTQLNGKAASNASTTVNGTTCTLGSSCTPPPPAQYKTWSCQPGLGDGLNAIAAGTYLSSTCKNTTGVTVTLTGLQCFTDNAGTSTMNAAGNTLGALLTGAVTCSTSFAAGTQSANVLLTNGDYIKFTFVADGTSKQTTWVVTGTY